MREPLDLWGQRGWHGQEVAGESHYFDAIRNVLGGRVSSEWTEVVTVAQLIPEPTNPYDFNAVQVLIDGDLVGYLPREEAARYVNVLSGLVAGGWLPQVSAQVRGAIVEDYDFDDDSGEDLRRVSRFVGSVRLDLAEPHLLVPANPPPNVPHVLLPYGNAIQVTGEEAYLSNLVPMIGPAGETWIHVTLPEITEQAARSANTLVEVRVNGLAAGRLTPKMSGELLPAIRHFAERGLITAGRAILKGNQLKADITLYVARAGQLPQSMLEATSDESALITAPVIPTQVAPEPGSATPTAPTAWRFNPPPGWPDPPRGWVPPAGWTPPPGLPPAPADWPWWVATG